MVSQSGNNAEPRQEEAKEEKGIAQERDLQDIELRLSGIVSESVVDGTGIRMTIFTQGCKHNCEGCHNPETHDVDGGEATDLKYILGELDKDPLLDGVTLSGGEPFLQAAALAALCREVHKRKLNVWCYSGYTYEQLCRLAETDVGVKSLLDNIDVLVDGKFVLAQRNLQLKFRGSDNQRVLDMTKTRAAGKAVWLQDMR